jgi:hypothetical protein
MNTRIFLRVVWAIFALVAPFVISHPFGLILGLGSFGLLLLPQRTAADEILRALSEGRLKVRWD